MFTVAALIMLTIPYSDSTSLLLRSINSVLLNSTLSLFNSSLLSSNKRVSKMSPYFHTLDSNKIDDNIYNNVSLITITTEAPENQYLNYYTTESYLKNKADYNNMFYVTTEPSYQDVLSNRKLSSAEKRLVGKTKQNSYSSLESWTPSSIYYQSKYSWNTPKALSSASPKKNLYNKYENLYEQEEYKENKKEILANPYKNSGKLYDKPIDSIAESYKPNEIVEDETDIIDEIFGVDEISPRYSINEEHEHDDYSSHDLHDFPDHQPYHSNHDEYIPSHHFHSYRHHRRPVLYPHHQTVLYTVPDHHYNHKLDFSKLGLIAIAKIILAKVKAWGLFKIILLFAAKIPLIILKIAIKAFLIFKAIKVFKFFTITSLIPLLIIPFLFLIPFLFIPLAPLVFLPLLIPLLLPLLLLLPVPVIGPATQPPIVGRRRRRRSVLGHRDWPNAGSSYEFLMLTRRVLESQDCLERMACNLASKQKSTFYNNVVLWLLDKLQLIIPNKLKPRMVSYTDAYKNGLQKDKDCSDIYQCTKSQIDIPYGSLIYELI